VEGRVQGVFFRKYTQDEARKLSLCGWVRNLPNGSVEAELEGEEQDIARMLSWFYVGSPDSLVRKVAHMPCEILRCEKDFVIRY
jgi:acylphosphatase